MRQPDQEWQTAVSAALSDLIDLGLAAAIAWVKEQARIAAEQQADNQVDDDPAASEAATLLGVAIDAPPDEIRAALRSKITERAIHPDHGGEGDEAARLIAAKNLLIDRWKVAA